MEKSGTKLAYWASKFVIGIYFLITPCLVLATELPKATLSLLQEINKSPDLMAGLDSELAVPDSWIVAAKQEGTLTISGTWDDAQFRKMIVPFNERYPFIKLRQLRGDRGDRVTKPLLAFSEGRIITDIIGGADARIEMFENAGALEDLRDLPGWSNIPDGGRALNGHWIAQRLRYWCTSYNTDLVSKDDLPKTWDDILTNPRWHGGAIGLGDRPNLWLLNLINEKGKDGVLSYMQTLFSVVHPQLRKEGLDGLVGLVVAGEFQMAIPQASDRVVLYLKKKAPIGWHCPEPVPAAITTIVIIKGNPHPYASKMFINWLVSKEGQISQFIADDNPPAHKDLQTRDFVRLADEIAGKRIAYANNEDTQWVFDSWYPLWGKAGSAVDKK